MNELIAVFLVLATLAVAYLWLYPRYAGNDVKRLALLDAGMTLIPIAVAGALFWRENPRFSLVFFDTNWFVFTLVTFVVLELPLFALYLKARGLGAEYLRLAFGKEAWSLSGTASVSQVEKQLDDQKWDGLRTAGARRFLVVGVNVVLIVGTLFLFAVDDGVWVIYSLIHILLIGVFWFLLRQSVRLVADAPDEALDERLRTERDQSYRGAYQVLAFIVTLLLIALMVYVVVLDSSGETDGFYYVISVTWPQVQAVFWLLLGYLTILPSAVLAWTEASRERENV